MYFVKRSAKTWNTSVWQHYSLCDHSMKITASPLSLILPNFNFNFNAPDTFPSDFFFFNE